jgi:plasmid stabilization system protein ParE
MKLKVALAANRDLRDIAEHIARDNPPRARSFIRELNEKIRKVAGQPLLYPLKEDWGHGRRSALHRNYHIVYRIEDDTVLVLRVLNGARDIPNLL